MARRSRKRATNEQLDGSPNHHEAQEQPTVVDAEKPQLLCPETESTLPKEPEIEMAEEKEVKKVEGKERNEPNQFRNEPDSSPAKETITKSVNDLDSKHRELCPKLDPLSPEDSHSVLLPEPEPVVVKNDANGLSTEPDSTTRRKKKKKRKGSSLSTRGGEETNDAQSEHRESIPNLDPLSPKESDPVLLPESQPVAEKSGANKLCAEPESATPRKKRKRKDKSLSMSEGIETNDVHSEHRELIPDLDPLPLKDSNSVLLPGPESFAEKNNTNQLCTEPESASPRKKKRRGKRKSLSNSEGVEVNHVNSERHELCPNLAEIPPKDTDPLLLPKPAPVGEKDEANQLCTKPDSTSPKFEGEEINLMDSGSVPPKDSNIVLLHEPESFAGKSDTNQLCTETESVTPRKKKRKGKRKSLSNSEGVEVNHVNSERHELWPNLAEIPPKDTDPLLLPEPAPVREKNEANQLCTKPDSASPKFEGAEIKDMDSGSVPPKDSNLVLLPEPESFAGKSDTNQLCTEPESVTPRKKRKWKRKSLSNSEGVEVNHVNSEDCELCPNLAALPPKDPDPLLLPEPAPVREKNEANQLRTKPDSTSPKFEGAEIKDMDSGSVAPKDSNFVLLPESKSFTGKNDTNQLCTEPESVTPRKKKRKGKRKSLSNSEGVEVNPVNSEDCELCPNLAALPPKDLDPLLLPEAASIREKNKANQLCTKPNSTSPQFEGAEIKDMESGSVAPKDSNFVLLPESESFAGKNDTNQLCTEPESVTPRKKKRKGKRKSLSNSEGVEVKPVNSEDCELCPNLAALPPNDPDPLLLPEAAPIREKNDANQLCTKPDSTSPKFGRAEIKDLDSGSVPPKDSNFVLLAESESFAGKNNTNQLCTEPESVTPRKKKRKGKRKSLSNSEGVEVNHMDSGHREPCPNLVALSPKDPDSLLLPEPAPVGEKNEDNKLCTKPDSTSPKFEGAEIKGMDSVNLELCPKLDPLPPKDSDLLLLPESDPAQPKGVDQEKKRKKNKGKLEVVGVESNRPNDEHSQQCHKAKPTTPEEQNQRKRKRQAMNETHDSSIQSMVNPSYDFGPRGASILNGEAISRGPWIPKMPLKDYERYERCLECGQICRSDQTCRGRLPYKKTQICFFCGTPGHIIGRCPISPGAKCSKGIIMLDDYVRNKCSKVAPANEPTYAPIYTHNPANVPTYAPIYTPFLPSNIHPYPAPFGRPTYAPF
ncbi:hypothetical protein K1719_028352 [Acacia pycnantha]|nr:hypothetical protein K1719_028352 [Acacia pycnantha]